MLTEHEAFALACATSCGHQSMRGTDSHKDLLLDERNAFVGAEARAETWISIAWRNAFYSVVHCERGINLGCHIALQAWPM